jgi:predicted DNA-binding antitoxin AbrB/MazE fold protein
MAMPIEAVYEGGVFRPLDEVELADGQRVSLSVEPLALSPAEAQAELREWQEVYVGLTEQDIEEVESIALDRSHFFRDSPSGSER